MASEDAKQFGKYEILEELGRGGFGTVYKANDLTLERVVALKVLHPQLTVDPRFIENFRKEARLMAKISHSNVVRVYEIDEFEGRVFIVMEYLPGGSLEERIAAEGPIPFEEALEITKQISKALEAGYKKNLIHRDVKPANILFDEDGNALLGDFGVAYTVQVSSMGTMSQGGVGVGTPSYRPPELWNGTPPPSQATDQYSLACVFYEMLTGDKLYGGETTEQIIVKMLIQEPDLEKMESEEIKSILKTAISKNPAERYASLEEFQKALAESDSPKIETEQIDFVDIVFSDAGADKSIGNDETLVKVNKIAGGKREYFEEDSNLAAIENDGKTEISIKATLRKILSRGVLVNILPVKAWIEKLRRLLSRRRKTKKIEDGDQSAIRWKPKPWQVLVFSLILVIGLYLFEISFFFFEFSERLPSLFFLFTGILTAVLHYRKNSNFPYAIKFFLDLSCFSFVLWVFGISIRTAGYQVPPIIWVFPFSCIGLLFFWIYLNFMSEELPNLRINNKRKKNLPESIKTALIIQAVLFLISTVPVMPGWTGELLDFSCSIQECWRQYLWHIWFVFSIIWWVIRFIKNAKETKK